VVGRSIDIAQNGYTPAAAAAIAGPPLRHHRRHCQQVPFQLVCALHHQCRQLKAKRSRSAATVPPPTPQSISRSPTSSSAHDVKVLQLGGRRPACCGDERTGRRNVEQYPDTAS